MRASYIGQCDQLRRGNADNEAKWHAMMERRAEVTFPSFVRNVDMSPLLDEGDTPESYIALASLSDPSTAAYRSWWGTQRCWFLQTAGFEFIFVER